MWAESDALFFSFCGFQGPYAGLKYDNTSARVCQLSDDRSWGHNILGYCHVINLYLIIYKNTCTHTYICISHFWDGFLVDDCLDTLYRIATHRRLLHMSCYWHVCLKLELHTITHVNWIVCWGKWGLHLFADLVKFSISLWK